MPLAQVTVIRHASGPVPGETEVEAKLHREGYDSFRWYDVPGSNYPKHRHALDECIWVLSGEIEFCVITDSGEVIHALQAGDRIYLPSGVAHTAKVSDRGVTYLVGQREKTVV